ncbi:MAG TPA: hypothetical protein VKU00_28155 [Chthonomonadaceae bacterium]|nr:hypothetical protein [Chthonomonadaceae bacterium]
MQHREDTSAEAEEDLYILVARLRSQDPRRRRRARRRLLRAGKAAFGPLSALLEEEGRMRRERRILRYSLAALTVGGYCWWAMHLAQPSYWPFAPLLLVPFVLALYLKAASRAQVEAAQMLAGLDDVRSVGPLAEALEFVDLWQLSGTDRIATEALCRLLPRLGPEDGNLLNTRQRDCLYHVLKLPMATQPQLILAILRTLTRIGDTRAMPAIARLADIQPMTLVGKQIVEAARESLATLQARLETERAPKILLRASDGETRSELLLHPVENPETNPTELLRPTDSN